MVDGYVTGSQLVDGATGAMFCDRRLWVLEFVVLVRVRIVVAVENRVIHELQIIVILQTRMYMSKSFFFHKYTRKVPMCFPFMHMNMYIASTYTCHSHTHNEIPMHIEHMSDVLL